MSADRIIQRINRAAERLRAYQEREEASKKQQQQLQAKLDADEKRISSLNADLAADEKRISSLKSELALGEEQLEKNAEQIEKLTASQLRIKEEAANLQRRLDANQKKLKEGYDKFNSGMTGFRKLEQEHKALQVKHAKNLKDIEGLQAQIKALTASELKAQELAKAADEKAKKWEGSNKRTVEMHRSDAEKYTGEIKRLQSSYETLLVNKNRVETAHRTTSTRFLKAQKQIEVLENEAQQREELVTKLREEAQKAKLENGKLDRGARRQLLEHKKIVEERDNMLKDKEALIKELQAKAKSQYTSVSIMRQEAQDTGEKLKDLEGQLKECLKHKEKLQKAQTKLEVKLEKSKTEQKLLKEKLKTKTKASKKKSADNLMNRVGPNQGQPPPPAKLRKPPVPQVRGAKVKRQIVVDYKERLKEVQKLLKQAINDKNTAQEKILADENNIARYSKQKEVVGTDGWNESDPEKIKAELQGRIDKIRKRLKKAKEKKKKAKEAETKLRRERGKLRKEAKNKEEDLKRMRLYLKRNKVDVKTDADVKELKRALKTYEYRADFTEFNKKLDQMTVENADEIVRELFGDVTAPPATPANPQGFQRFHQGFQIVLRF